MATSKCCMWRAKSVVCASEQGVPGQPQAKRCVHLVMHTQTTICRHPAPPAYSTGNQIAMIVIQVEEGAALVFNSTDGELYNLWFREALPTYGGPLRYRAHLDCDRCRWLRIADSTPAPAERSQMCDRIERRTGAVGSIASVLPPSGRTVHQLRPLDKSQPAVGCGRVTLSVTP